MQVIYYESAVKNHPRVKKITEEAPKTTQLIECEHYQEVFNLKSQNFRIQKELGPALILAYKSGKKVLPTPPGFGIGGKSNYYFSHMLNCLYDCRYCFLQGMYPSAHYVVFVNFNDFMDDIVEITNTSEDEPYFFSGYDGDSLAYNRVTGFIEEFIPFFARNPRAILELRTKSTHIRPLLSFKAIPNCVVAFSFTPAPISERIEYKVPSLSKRLNAMKQLADAGWRIGLRFDPLIATQDDKSLYAELITQIFEHIDAKAVHSISVGPLRFPQQMYQKIVKLYPHEKLLAQPLVKRAEHYSYEETVESSLKQFVLDELQKYISPKHIFECNNLS